MIEDSSEIFNVYSKPKFIEKDENEIPISPNIPDSSVGTGDNTNVILWTVLLLVSWISYVKCYKKTKKIIVLIKGSCFIIALPFFS